MFWSMTMALPVGKQLMLDQLIGITKTLLYKFIYGGNCTKVTEHVTSNGTVKVILKIAVMLHNPVCSPQSMFHEDFSLGFKLVVWMQMQHISKHSAFTLH